jgi:transcriptional regulator with XRE-family HTH domain
VKVIPYGKTCSISPTIGPNLALFSTIKKMTQEQLAKQTMIRQATISLLESSGDARFSTICQLLTTLDLEIVARPRTRDTSQDWVEEFFK